MQNAKLNSKCRMQNAKLNSKCRMQNYFSLSIISSFRANAMSVGISLFYFNYNNGDCHEPTALAMTLLFIFRKNKNFCRQYRNSRK